MHLRKKEKWLDHARAMIEGKSSQDRAIVRRSSDDGAVPLATSVSRAPAVNKPRSLSGSSKRTKPSSSNPFKGRWSDLPRKARKRGGTARHAGLYQDNISILVARDRTAPPSTRILPQVDGASVSSTWPASSRRAIISSAMAGRRSPLSPAELIFHDVPAGKADTRGPAPHINNAIAYHGRLKQWLNRFTGVATKNLPNYLGWRRALEAWGDKLEPPTWIKGAIGNGPYQQISL